MFSLRHIEHDFYAGKNTLHFFMGLQIIHKSCLQKSLFEDAS